MWMSEATDVGVGGVLLLDDREILFDSLHHVGHRAGRIVRAVDRPLEHRFRNDVRLDLVAGDELDVVDGEDVRRVRHRDHEPAPDLAQRQGHELDRDVPR